MEKKEPRQVGSPPLSFGELISDNPQHCFVCYGRSSPFEHDHGTCQIHKAQTEAHKKGHGTKRRRSANIWGAKVGVSQDEISKLMMVGIEPAKGIQDIKRSSRPKSDKDRDKDKDKKGKGGWRKKGDAVNEFAAEQDTPTSDAP